MARATKCPKCGMMQMSTTGQCKKCGVPLAVQSVRPRSVARPPAAQPPPLDDNPYVPPQTALGGLHGQASDGIFRDGKTLVASHDALFPDRCVKCNQPAGGYRLKRRLTWHPQGWYALILVNVLVYAVVATIIQKKCEFQVGLCARHRQRRLGSIGLGLALPLLGGVGCTMRIEDPSGIWIGILSFAVGMVLLIAGTSVLSAQRIDERFAHIRGASPTFLASLPPFHG